MPFLSKHFAFFHIPKTAGVWVGNVLAAVDPPVDDYRRHWRPKQFKNDFNRTTFTIVRHPARWFQSFYTYTLQQGNHLKGWRQHQVFPEFPFLHPYMNVTTNFNDFMEIVIDEHPGWLSKVCFSYIEGVEFVLRTEDLPNALVQLLEEKGLETKPAYALGKQNVSAQNNDLVVYKEDVLLALLESEKEILDRWYKDYDWRPFCTWRAGNAQSSQVHGSSGRTVQFAMPRTQ